MNNNYWQGKNHCHKQRKEASQIYVKLPKLIRCIPSMILKWLNHLWLNKPYPGGDCPLLHRYLGKTPLSRSQRITHGSHTVGCKMQVSPNWAVWHNGRELICSLAHPFACSSAQSLIHLATQTLTHSLTRAQTQEKAAHSLPVNDHRVWWSLVPVSTAFLVTAPAMGT